MGRASTLLVCIFFFLAAATAQDSREEPAAAAGAEARAANSDQPRRRIVDPEKFPPKGSAVGRVLLAPFRAIGPAINRGLTYAEENNLQERLRVWFSHPHARPLFGGLGDGSGFGAGVELSTADALSRNLRLATSFHGTPKRYMETWAGLRADPTGGGLRVFDLDLRARYSMRPQEDFWGLGPRSLETDRSSYETQERGVALTATLRPHKALRLGAGLDFSSTRVLAGEDHRYPTTQAVFGPTLPGIVGGAELFGPVAFLEFDTRDKPNNPRRGAFMKLTAASLDSVDSQDFGFVSLRADGRAYFPLGTPRRVLAIRLLGETNDPKGGSQVPFFRLARLGATDTLRGYNSYRFHGRHALMSSVEYRYQLIQGLDMVFFTDIGQVFDTRSQLSMNNTHVTWGLGPQFKTSDSVLFKVLVAKSGEGARVFFNFGPTF